MVRPELAILPILVTILTKTNVNDAKFSDNSLVVLSKILGKHSRSPVIVLIEAPSKSNNPLRSSDDQGQDNYDVERIHGFDDSIDETKTLQYVSDILRSTGDENDPTVAKTNLKFERALRSRCEAYLECQVKCRKVKCKKSCQDVFDYLMMCNPPGKKFTISCGPKCGKTMPPKW